DWTEAAASANLHHDSSPEADPPQPHSKMPSPPGAWPVPTQASAVAFSCVSLAVDVGRGGVSKAGLTCALEPCPTWEPTDHDQHRRGARTSAARSASVTNAPPNTLFAESTKVNFMRLHIGLSDLFEVGHVPLRAPTRFFRRGNIAADG